jgi:hypothetical protein
MDFVWTGTSYPPQEKWFGNFYVHQLAGASKGREVEAIGKAAFRFWLINIEGRA